MNNDIQKAGFVKRVAAGTFDAIMIACLVVMIAIGLSALLGYDNYMDQWNGIYERYSEEYDIDLNISSEEYAKLTEEEKTDYLEKYEKANEALQQDEEAIQLFSMLVSLALTITSISILLGFLIWEFAIPLWLGNGQTVGKKAFSIALMRTDGVKITPMMMFARSILGKCAIETLPVALVVVMLLLNVTSGFGILFVGLILLAQVILLIVTRTNSMLHDMLACTVVVDMSSQRIFDSPEARMEYLKRISQEQARNAGY